MKKTIAAILTIAILIGVMSSALACTTILVGKDASTDGYAYMGRTNDDSAMYATKLYIFPACDEEGTYEYHDPEIGLDITLPKANYRCIIEPSYKESSDVWWESGFNDAGVGMSATETISIIRAIRDLDPFVKVGLCEGNMPRLILPYVSSAKGAAERMGSLIEEVGAAASEAVAFIDNDGIWYLETLSGHHWVAHRLPDDEYACIGNDCLLDYYDPDDTENWIGSDGVIELAKEAGTYTEVDGRFHLALSYSAGKRDYSQLRVWAGRRFFNGYAADSYDVNTTFNFSEKPDNKISLQEIFALTRDRHEGTPKATDIDGNNTRPIAIDRTAQSHMLQCKEGTEPVMWACLTAPEFGVYLPVYANAASLPDGLTVSTEKFDETSFSWQLRLISDLAVTDRSLYSELVRAPFRALEDELIESVHAVTNPTADEAAQALANVSDMAWARMNEVKIDLITEVSRNTVNATRRLGRD